MDTAWVIPPQHVPVRVRILSMRKPRYHRGVAVRRFSDRRGRYRAGSPLSALAKVLGMNRSWMISLLSAGTLAVLFSGSVQAQQVPDEVCAPVGSPPVPLFAAPATPQSAALAGVAGPARSSGSAALFVHPAGISRLSGGWQAATSALRPSRLPALRGLQVSAAGPVSSDSQRRVGVGLRRFDKQAGPQDPCYVGRWSDNAQTGMEIAVGYAQRVGTRATLGARLSGRKGVDGAGGWSPWLDLGLSVRSQLPGLWWNLQLGGLARLMNELAFQEALWTPPGGEHWRARVGGQYDLLHGASPESREFWLHSELLVRNGRWFGNELRMAGEYVRAGWGALRAGMSYPLGTPLTHFTGRVDASVLDLLHAGFSVTPTFGETGFELSYSYSRTWPQWPGQVHVIGLSVTP